MRSFNNMADITEVMLTGQLATSTWTSCVCQKVLETVFCCCFVYIKLRNACKLSYQSSRYILHKPQK